VAFAAVALAGCAEGDADGPGAAEGRGAIAGLLLDDRFRPIHLTDTPETAFDAAGFVLLQETGEQAQTSVNGEFTFPDVEPGAYTLRVQAAGHEAMPQTIEVKAQEVSETSVVARRISTASNTILTEEHSLFMTCQTYTVFASWATECFIDLSKDSFRYSVWRDFTQIDGLTWLVAEMKLNQVPEDGGTFDGHIRQERGVHYTTVKTPTDFLKMHAIPGGLSPDPVPDGDTFVEWPNTARVEIALYGSGALGKEVGDAYAPVYEAIGKDLPPPANSGMNSGLGIRIAPQAELVISLFLGEPETDPSTYCVLCS
jgi:hypothetical protein